MSIKFCAIFMFILLAIGGCDSVLPASQTEYNAKDYRGTFFHSPPYTALNYFDGEDLPLATAIENGNLQEVLRLALQTDLASFGQKNRSFLHFALYQAELDYTQERLDAISTIVRQGAGVHQQPLNMLENNTPLHEALRNAENFPLLLKALLDGGLSPNDQAFKAAPTSRIINTLLADRYLNALKILINYGADVNVRDNMGGVPLENAFDIGAYDSINFLLDNGANPENVSLIGYTLVYQVYEALHTYDEGYPKFAELRRLAERLKQIGCTWPPLTPVEQRDILRAKGMEVFVPHDQSR